MLWDDPKPKLILPSDYYDQYSKNIIRSYDTSTPIVPVTKYRVECLSGYEIGIAYCKSEAVKLFHERYSYLPKKYLTNELAEPFIQEICL